MRSIICTKLRMGDANSMMSQGGMQAAVSRTDSPTRHYLDAIGGGHFENKPELVRALTEDGPGVVKWLEDLGVVWDKLDDGSLKTMHGGGTSRNRMLSCRDYTGAMIMRTLMDEVRNHPDMIDIKEFMPAVELIMDNKGNCAGAVLYDMETSRTAASTRPTTPSNSMPSWAACRTSASRCARTSSNRRQAPSAGSASSRN